MYPYLIKSMEKCNDMQLLKESIKLNVHMPQYACDKLVSIVDKFNNNLSDMNILMLGKAYKPNSADTRRSQAIVLYEIIKKKQIIFILLIQ